MMEDVCVEAGPTRERVRLAYEACYDRLWRSVLGFSGSVDVADDAVSEAFAQVLRRGSEIRDVEAWVWRSAFAIASGELARRRRDDYRVPERIDELPEQTVDLIAALAELPDSDRELLVLRHVAGFAPAELAVLMNTRAATLRVRLHRATRRARPILEDLR